MSSRPEKITVSLVSNLILAPGPATSTQSLISSICSSYFSHLSGPLNSLVTHIISYDQVDSLKQNLPLDQKDQGTVLCSVSPIDFSSMGTLSGVMLPPAKLSSWSQKHTQASASRQGDSLKGEGLLFLKNSVVYELE